MDESPADWQVLVTRAQETAALDLQPDELTAIDAALDAAIDDGVRGSLLLARSIARQGDADITHVLADSARAFELLSASGRVDEAALAAAVTGVMHQRAGDIETAVDHAVEAMVLVDVADRTPTAARAANALAVLFAQLSAFEQAMTFSNLASDVYGHDGCTTLFAIPYTRCSVSVEAHHAGIELPLAPAHQSVAQLLKATNPVARTMLGPGMAIELARLERPGEDRCADLDRAAMVGAAPRLAAWFKLVLADSEYVHGTKRLGRDRCVTA